ncbi:hypothetical protein PVT01_000076500 [Plasmodium vivax]|uniref:VIR protein n=1 Tax=Plasmodium vivax TaxID=5855 RepID=A0A1G4E261_PLAVI|nr:hypothetical protein PVT01_000076500 [Plasmodium vivax]
MKDINHNHCCEQSERYLNSVDHTKREELKNIGCSVECGYHYLTVFNDKRLTDLCMYLNLWLDEQKSTHINGIFVITEAEWNLIEKLWNDLYHKRHSNRKCERQPEKKNIFEYSKRKELMTYCINRDYFKSLFQSTTGSLDFKLRKCNGFSDYTSKYYDKLIKGIDCIDRKSDSMRYKYHISDDCTLYDIPKTFPICEAHTPTIIYDDNSKANIICKTTAEVGSATPVSAENHAEPTQREGAPDNLPETADNHGEHSEIPNGPVKLPDGADDSAKLGEFDHQLSPTLPSTNNWPSKPIYYSGLSALGVVFTSTVLYKV